MFEIKPLHILIIVGVLLVIWYLVKKSNENFESTQPPLPHFKPVFYNFYTLRCPHSKEFNPIWETLISEKWDVDFRSIDIDDPEMEDVVFYFNVNATPTLILSLRDQNVAYEGPRDIQNMRSFLHYVLKSNQN